MRAKEFLNFVKIDSLAPVYLIKGADLFFARESLKVIEKTLEFTLPDFNITKFDDENFEIATMLDACKQMPMIDLKRLVVLFNISALKEKDKQALSEYVRTPNTDTVLVIWDNINNDQYKYLEEKLEVIDCSKLTHYEQQQAIKDMCLKQNVTITPVAINTLLTNTANNLSLCEQEIVKLKDYSNNGLIDEIAVKSLTSEVLEYQVYELSNALSLKQGTKALKMLKDMLTKKEQPTAILALITNHFRRMFYVSTSSSNVATLAMLFKVKEFAIQKANEQASNFSQRKLKDILSLLEEVDFNIKSGLMNPVNSLYYLVLSILNK